MKTKAEAGYRAATGKNRCGNCRFFNPRSDYVLSKVGAGRCLRVFGFVLTDDVCDLYQGYEPNPRRTRRPTVWAGERDEFFVDVWEERDRLHIALRFDPQGSRKVHVERGGDLVAEWWDEDARQMFEDGFFKPGRELEESVVQYAQHVGLVTLV